MTSSIKTAIKELKPRNSILKPPTGKIFKNGYLILPDKNASQATRKERQDFYGNVISAEKRHKIFFNLSANTIILVKSLKEFNHKQTHQSDSKKKCQVF